MMTAEVIIMNKEAVAFAADSAVTMTEEKGLKIFTSANKIFALSMYYPVGIMVYGAANFMKVPWETIIKIYRDKLNSRKFDTLEEYADDFIGFLTKGKQLFPKSEQEIHFKRYIYSYFINIRQQIEKEVSNYLTEKNKQISIKQIKDIISKVIKQHHKIWDKTEILPSIPKTHSKDLLKYRKIIEEAKKNVFERLPISTALSILLTEIATSLFSKFPKEISPPSLSGVVIAGFGDKDIYPSLRSFFLEGITNNVLKYKKGVEHKVSLKGAAIIPFAQHDMVYTFMEGISPDYEEEIEKYFSQICEKYPKIIFENINKLYNREKVELTKIFKKVSSEWIKKYRKRLENYRKKNIYNTCD